VSPTLDTTQSGTMANW